MIIVWQLYGTIENKYILAWSLCVLVVIIFRIILYFWYKKTRNILKLLYYHYYFFIIGSCLSAILLGLAASLLMPNLILHQAVILILISGIIAGASQSLRTSLFASISYILLILIPVLVWEFLQILDGKMIYLGVFLSMSLFCLYSYAMIKRNNLIVKKHLELEYNYKMLLQRVSKVKNELKEKASHDLLTGLYNRQFLIDCLEIELNKAKRIQETVAIIMMDLDHFKKCNDQYGHLVGDLFLQAYATVINQHIRNTDIACRYGGEEFIIVLPGISIKYAMEKAELLRVEIKKVTVEKNNETIPGMTVSLGVAFYPIHALNKMDLIEAADKALYKAKQSGRNRVVLADNHHHE